MASNVDIAREAYAAYSVGDVEGTARVFAADAVIHGPVAHGEFETVDWTTRGGLAAFVAQIAEHWHLEAYEVIRLEAEGEWVTAFIRIAARNWRTKKRFDGMTVDVLRFRDGMCVEFYEIVDREAMRVAAQP